MESYDTNGMSDGFGRCIGEAPSIQYRRMTYGTTKVYTSISAVWSSTMHDHCRLTEPINATRRKSTTKCTICRKPPRILARWIHGVAELQLPMLLSLYAQQSMTPWR